MGGYYFTNSRYVSRGQIALPIYDVAVDRSKSKTFTETKIPISRSKRVKPKRSRSTIKKNENSTEIRASRSRGNINSININIGNKRQRATSRPPPDTSRRLSSRGAPIIINNQLPRENNSELGMRETNMRLESIAQLIRAQRTPQVPLPNQAPMKATPQVIAPQGAPVVRCNAPPAPPPPPPPRKVMAPPRFGLREQLIQELQRNQEARAGGTPIAPVLFRRARQNPNAIKRAEPPSPNIPIPETPQVELDNNIFAERIQARFRGVQGRRIATQTNVDRRKEENYLNRRANIIQARIRGMQGRKQATQKKTKILQGFRSIREPEPEPELGSAEKFQEIVKAMTLSEIKERESDLQEKQKIWQAIVDRDGGTDTPKPADPLARAQALEKREELLEAQIQQDVVPTRGSPRALIGDFLRATGTLVGRRIGIGSTNNDHLQATRVAKEQMRSAGTRDDPIQINLRPPPQNEPKQEPWRVGGISQAHSAVGADVFQPSNEIPRTPADRAEDIDVAELEPEREPLRPRKLGKTLNQLP